MEGTGYRIEPTEVSHSTAPARAPSPLLRKLRQVQFLRNVLTENRTVVGRCKEFRCQIAEL